MLYSSAWILPPPSRPSTLLSMNYLISSTHSKQSTPQVGTHHLSLRISNISLDVKTNCNGVAIWRLLPAWPRELVGKLRPAMPLPSPNHAVDLRICLTGSTKSRGGMRPPTVQHNLMQKCSTDTTLACQLTHIMYHRITSQRFPGSVNLLARNRFSGCLMLVALPPPVWMGCRTGIYV